MMFENTLLVVLQARIRHKHEYTLDDRAGRYRPLVDVRDLGNSARVIHDDEKPVVHRTLRAFRKLR